jgi:hypothetical protein
MYIGNISTIRTNVNSQLQTCAKRITTAAIDGTPNVPWNIRTVLGRIADPAGAVEPCAFHNVDIE